VDHLKEIGRGGENVYLAPRSVLDLVLKPKTEAHLQRGKRSGDLSGSVKHSEVQEKMKNLHFWIELIDGTMERLYGLSLFQRECK
jgi:hypothetical protein